MNDALEFRASQGNHLYPDGVRAADSTDVFSLYGKVGSSGADAVERWKFVSGWQWNRNVGQRQCGHCDERDLHGGDAQADG